MKKTALAIPLNDVGNGVIFDLSKEFTAPKVPVLYGHDIAQPPIGTATFKMSDDGLLADIVFADTERAKEVIKLNEEEILKGVSVGIQNFKENDGVISNFEIYELSITPFPAFEKAQFNEDKTKLTFANILTFQSSPSKTTKNFKLKATSKLAVVKAKFEALKIKAISKKFDLEEEATSLVEEIANISVEAANEIIDAENLTGDEQVQANTQIDELRAQIAELTAQLEQLLATEQATSTNDTEPSVTANYQTKFNTGKIMETPKTFNINKLMTTLQQNKTATFDNINAYGAQGYIENLNKAFKLDTMPLFFKMFSSRLIDADTINYSQFDTSKAPTGNNPTQEGVAKPRANLSNSQIIELLQKIALSQTITDEAVQSSFELERKTRQILQLLMSNEIDKFLINQNWQGLQGYAITKTNSSASGTAFLEILQTMNEEMLNSSLFPTVGLITPTLFTTLIRARASAESSTQTMNILQGMDGRRQFIDLVEYGIRLYSSLEYANAIKAVDATFDCGITLFDPNFIELILHRSGQRIELNKIVRIWDDTLKENVNSNLWDLTIEDRIALSFENLKAVNTYSGKGWTF